MPTYDYRCKNCGTEMEEKQSMHDEPLTTCPKCKKNTLVKIVTNSKRPIFKGRGWMQRHHRYR